jgi:hypothetical protein
MRIVLEGGPRDGEVIDADLVPDEREAALLVDDDDYKPYFSSFDDDAIAEIRFHHREIIQDKYAALARARGIPVNDESESPKIYRIDNTVSGAVPAYVRANCAKDALHEYARLCGRKDYRELVDEYRPRAGEIAATEILELPVGATPAEDSLQFRAPRC